MFYSKEVFSAAAITEAFSQNLTFTHTHSPSLYPLYKKRNTVKAGCLMIVRGRLTVTLISDNSSFKRCSWGLIVSVVLGISIVIFVRILEKV